MVDDGSTDLTQEVITQIPDDRIRYVYQENQGRTVVRNVGAAMARGQFVTFLDSDDEVLPNWLEDMALHCRMADTGIVCCGATVIDANTREQIKVVLPESMGSLFGNQSSLLFSGCVSP